MTSEDSNNREFRSFLMARDPSIDPRFRPRPEKRLRLLDELSEDFSESDITGNSNSEIENCEGALVYLRLRPIEKPSTVYTITGTTLVTAASNENVSTSNNKNAMEKHYSFSAIFDPYVEQQQVYEECVRNKIEEEENFTVLAYGTSGSGKTFTLLGDTENPGIIPRSLQNIFTKYCEIIYPLPSLKLIKGQVIVLNDDDVAAENRLCDRMSKVCSEVKQQEQYVSMEDRILDEHIFTKDDNSNTAVVIWISFVEIYNESVYDLLEPPSTTQSTMMAPPPRKTLKILTNNGHVFIKGLTTICVKSSLEALRLLRYGLQRVNYASTSINSNSSRSHCIFVVDILKYHTTGLLTSTSYKFCDLAGSERLDKTGNTGSRLKEAQSINTSLMILGRCLDAIRKTGGTVVPFRESKLTMLLQASLLGKEKMTMIVTVTPNEKYYEENLNVLGFASIAKNIIFKQPVVKQNKSRYSFFLSCSRTDTNDSRFDNEYVKQLLEENIFLRSEIDRLKSQHQADLFNQEKYLRNKLVDEFEATERETRERFETRLQQQLDALTRRYESQISALKRKHEAEMEDLREEYEESDDLKENVLE